MQGVVLGPFRLEERIGQGGMGEVWRARHVAQGAAVAVKVMSPSAAADEEFLQSFRNEVRAVAALHHPHVVTVLDYGQAPATAGAAAGAPYLVMDLADRGSLASRRGRLPWEDLRAVLLALLDALAHAHARDVIHRDLKPHNVLISSTHGVVLTDFGLAHLLDRAGDTRHVRAGTPAYMAPEQVHARWRDFGPWTDLYAFGCLATTLATGAPPFGKRPMPEMMIAHLSETPPPLVPVNPVPEGFQEWVSTLLAKEPDQRYRRAADAAWALQQLGEPVGMGLPARPSDPDDPSRRSDTNRGPMRSAFGTTLPTWAAGAAKGTVPPMPSTWRSATPTEGASDLRGVGLGLYGLRSIPLAGREPERDRIWAGLVRVRESGRAGAVVLHGPAGTGKSRLARWIASRAHEVGAATVVSAVHGPGGAPSEGLVGMAQAALGCAGLDRAEIEKRVVAFLGSHGVYDPLGRAALVDLLAAPTGNRADLKRAERLVTWGKLLERLAGERPLIVLLDDVQWSGDAIDLVSHVLGRQAQTPFPALFVVTVQDEALAEAPRERVRLLALQGLAGVERLEIAPLAGRAWTGLVRTLLGLNGALARKVEARAAGNPLFAVHLVGDWVQRGLLLPGPSGFELAPGAVVDLPEAIAEVWSARVDQSLEGLPPAAGHALELAAALGPVVYDMEWRAACAHARVNAAPGLVDRLVARRLARIEGAGWSFVHGMLRESLNHRAAAGRRAARWHKACAAMLDESRRQGRRGLATRMARHLAEAGDAIGGLAPMLDAATEARDTDAYDLAHALLDEREGWMRREGIPTDDARWGAGQVVRAEVFRLEGRYPEAWEAARRADADSRRFGWDRVLPDALATQGHVARQQGELDDSERLLTQALGLYTALDDPRGVATATNTLGIVCKRLARLDQAWGLQQQAKGMFERMGDRLGVAHTLRELADIAMTRGEADTSEALYGLAMRQYTEVGNRNGMAYVHNSLGQLLSADDMDGAIEEYRKAIQMYDQIGSPQAAIPAANLGSIYAMRGEWAAALARLSDAARRYDELGWATYSAAARAELLGVAVKMPDWAAFDAQIAALNPLVDRLGGEPSTLDVLVKAGDDARDAGQAERAQAAWAVAEAAARIVRHRPTLAAVALRRGAS